MSTVTRETRLCLTTPAGHRCPIPAEWCYSAADPLAVSLLIHAGRQGTVTWRFGRDLLSFAFVRPDHWVGEGDVRIRVEWDVALDVRVCAPSGDAVLSCPLDAAQDFLVETYVVCGPVAELAAVVSAAEELACGLGELLALEQRYALPAFRREAA